MHAKSSGDSRYGKDVYHIFRKSSKNFLWPNIENGNASVRSQRLPLGDYRIKTNAQWNALENISTVWED